MENRSDPVRWLHPDSDVPAELRSVLGSAQGDGGGADALSSLAAKLPLAAGAKVSGAAAAGAAKKAILSWKLALWVAGAAAVGGAATNLIALVPSSRPAIAASAPLSGPARSGDLARVESEGETASHERANSPIAGVESASLPAATEEPPPPKTANHHSLGAPPPAGAPASSPAAPTVASASAPSALPSAGRTPDSLGAEARLLLQAREAMARDPRKALRVTEAHDSAFADGALAEESEVLRVEALVRIGKREEAARVAAAFRARHPQSSHLTRLDRLLRVPR